MKICDDCARFNRGIAQEGLEMACLKGLEAGNISYGTIDTRLLVSLLNTMENQGCPPYCIALVRALITIDKSWDAREVGGE